MDTVPMPVGAKPEPCPFCGTLPNAIKMQVDGGSAWHCVVCPERECYCEGPNVGPHKDWGVGREKAIAAWNSRVVFAKKS